METDDDGVPALVPAAREDGTDRRTPVTILTGFLGAGKTTLVSHVLRERHGHRIAVILNEIGEGAGVERGLVLQRAGGSAPAEWIELDNGCLCCSAK